MYCELGLGSHDPWMELEPMFRQNRLPFFAKTLSLASLMSICAFAALPNPATAQAPPIQSQGTAPAPGATAPDLTQGTVSVLKNRPAAAAPVPPAGAPAGLVPVPPISDSEVRPASATSPLDPAAPSASGAPRSTAKADEPADGAAQAAAIAAGDLLARALTSPKDSAVSGRAWPLLDALNVAPGDRARQMRIVRAYWALSALQADYNWAVDEAAQLDLIRPAPGPVDSATLATARAAAQARLSESRLVAVTAQQDFADLVGWATGTPLPLAADLPLVGGYRTYFDTLFANRAPPARMRAIDRTLPIRREAIEAHALAVQAAASAVHYSDEARDKGQADLQSLLANHGELSRQRRAFLAAVRDYNLDIGEYALTVADPSVTNDRLVGMLIRQKNPTASGGAAGSTAPGGAAAERTRDPFARPPATDPLMQPAVQPDSHPDTWGPAGGANPPPRTGTARAPASGQPSPR